MPPAIVAGTETVIVYCVLLLVPVWAPALSWVLGFLLLGDVALRLTWARRRL